MEYFDHAMVGATLAVASGMQRRHGWPALLLAALAGMAPDWDALSKYLSPPSYRAVHRAWGHNLFSVTLVGAALGGLAFLIESSLRRRGLAATGAGARAGPWILLGVLIAWTHPLLDMLYCGPGRNAEWPVRLLWPIASGGFAAPMVPWSDRGATALLAGGLLLISLARGWRQAAACVSLVLLGGYITVRGAMLHAG
jgi:membrane-bound metal-dependent hydrolase YbcI (DUF457 family)